MHPKDEPRQDETNRELRWLRVYMAVTSAALAILALGAFRAPADRVSFTEIDVERINVVERDGKVRLVLANRDRSPGAIINGKRLSPEGRRPGLIFYNDEADEVGGLTFGGRRDTTGYWNSVSLTFDQFKQDQVVALQHIDENGRRFQGMTILDRPEVALDWVIEEDRRIGAMPAGPVRDSARARWVESQDGRAYGVPRLFIGRDRGKASAMRLYDRDGRPRLRITVDSLGTPSIDFLNDSGVVVHRIAAP
jgi:hypothetical protein